MRKFVTFAVTTTLAVTLAACGKKAETEKAEEGTVEETTEEVAEEAIEEEAEVVAEGSLVAGGWQVNDDGVSSLLTPEQAEVFQKAMGELLGVNYEPVSVIGQQVVAGMNYAYLCKSTVVSPEAQPEWDVVVIYNDLEGNATFTSATPIDLADVKLVSGEAGEAVGAWEVPEATGFCPLPDAAYDALDALAAKDGYELNPQALLGTQIVAGTNYQVLCVGRSTATEDAPFQLFDVTIYEDLDGKGEVTSIEAVDLVSYVSAE